MKPVYYVLFAAGLVFLGAVTWWLLTLPKPQAGWLSAEAPAQARPGETLTLRVRLSKPDPALQLVTDLHGWAHRNHALGAIAHQSPRQVAPSNPSADFPLSVPILSDLVEVRAVIYLTPTGRWKDAVHVAMSDPIPVRASAESAGSRLQPLPAHEFAPDPVIPRLESSLLRGVIVGLWLLVASALALQWHQLPAPTSTREWRFKTSTLVLVAACFAAAVSEVAGAEQSIGDFAREFARHHGLYEERHLPQQIAVLLTVVGITAVISLIIVRARRRRLVCGLLAYAIVAIVATLSLHETDALLYTTIVGQPVEQLAKLVAVALSLWGLQTVVGRSAP